MSSNEPGPRSCQEQQRLERGVVELFEERITFNQYIGLKVQRLNPRPVIVECKMRPELVGHYLYGRLHGGVVASIIDVVGGLAVMMAISDYHASDSSQQVMHRFKDLATIDLRIDYLRPGIGEHFNAQAEIVRLGKRVAVTRMSLVSSTGKEVATGNGTYVVSDK